MAKQVKMPQAPSAEKGCVKEAPSSKKKSLPQATAPAGVSSGDGDGQKIAISADMAKMAPKTSPSNTKVKGESMEMKKPDAEGKLK